MQLQKLGIEVRKIGDLKNLFTDVDVVLSKYSIPLKGVSVGVQIHTVAHALHKMFRAEKHFSICVVENCAKTCQVVISKERLDIYSSIHCVDWSEMTPEYRQMICAMVLDDFREVLTIDL